MPERRPKTPARFPRSWSHRTGAGDSGRQSCAARGYRAERPLTARAAKGDLKAAGASGAKRKAHTINGASANAGGGSLALAAVAFEMEMAGKAGDLDAIKTSMAELEAQFGRLNQAITDELLQP